MITITALKWAPPFAAGQVRDHRARWILNEVGWEYRVRLVDAPELSSPEYKDKQPFGQVPYLDEDGRPTLFESGAIVLDIAMRADKLLPKQDGARSAAISWLFAALSSVEPFLMNAAEVEYF
ncbi:MAG TPA: glutathione S-transferase N-terminal domain-containing protein, partial [Polyangiales bacterium]|nr:glutathione S-transferase N-terminal domain-containing protein [Polyangiales bacterium]